VLAVAAVAAGESPVKATDLLVAPVVVPLPVGTKRKNSEIAVESLPKLMPLTSPLDVASNLGSEEVRMRITLAVLHLKFEGHQLKSIICIELFSGTARLTLCLSDLGLDALGFDSVRNRAKVVGRSITVDLLTAPHQKLITGAIESGRVGYVGASPPCGTASRARDIPLPGGKGPKPLRSMRSPLGLPGLSGIDLIRTEAANGLYKFVALVMALCVALQVPFTVENPLNSYFWVIDFIVATLELSGVEDTAYDACMHGGARLKHQRLRHNNIEFRAMKLVCDGGHQHKPWKKTPGSVRHS
jgi:hypothetical protein